jgi:hypothetical protein
VGGFSASSLKSITKIFSRSKTKSASKASVRHSTTNQAEINHVKAPHTPVIKSQSDSTHFNQAWNQHRPQSSSSQSNAYSHTSPFKTDNKSAFNTYSHQASYGSKPYSSDAHSEFRDSAISVSNPFSKSISHADDTTSIRSSQSLPGYHGGAHKFSNDKDAVDTESIRSSEALPGYYGANKFSNEKDIGDSGSIHSTQSAPPTFGGMSHSAMPRADDDQFDVNSMSIYKNHPNYKHMVDDDDTASIRSAQSAPGYLGGAHKFSNETPQMSSNGVPHQEDETLHSSELEKSSGNGEHTPINSEDSGYASRKSSIYTPKNLSSQSIHYRSSSFQTRQFQEHQSEQISERSSDRPIGLASLRAQKVKSEDIAPENERPVEHFPPSKLSTADNISNKTQLLSHEEKQQVDATLKRMGSDTTDADVDKMISSIKSNPHILDSTLGGNKRTTIERLNNNPNLTDAQREKIFNALPTQYQSKFENEATDYASTMNTSIADLERDAKINEGLTKTANVQRAKDAEMFS